MSRLSFRRRVSIRLAAIVFTIFCSIGAVHAGRINWPSGLDTPALSDLRGWLLSHDEALLIHWLVMEILPIDATPRMLLQGASKALVQQWPLYQAPFDQAFSDLTRAATAPTVVADENVAGRSLDADGRRRAQPPQPLMAWLGSASTTANHVGDEVTTRTLVEAQKVVAKRLNGRRGRAPWSGQRAGEITKAYGGILTAYGRNKEEPPITPYGSPPDGGGGHGTAGEHDAPTPFAGEGSQGGPEWIPLAPRSDSPQQLAPIRLNPVLLESDEDAAEATPVPPPIVLSDELKAFIAEFREIALATGDVPSDVVLAMAANALEQTMGISFGHRDYGIILEQCLKAAFRPAIAELAFRKYLAGGADAIETSRSNLKSLDPKHGTQQAGWMRFGSPYRSATPVMFLGR